MNMILTFQESMVKEVKTHCQKYETMTLDELKEVIKSIDKSENCVLINHDSLQSKEQILDFLFGWTYCQINGENLNL